MYNRRMRDPNDQERIILTGLQRTDGIELSMAALACKMQNTSKLMPVSKVNAQPTYRASMVSCLSLINRQAMAGLVRPVLWRSAIAMPIVLTPPNYARFDARLGYQWQAWRTQLSVENLLDKDYYLSATSSTQIQPGAPREFYLTASYQF